MMVGGLFLAGGGGEGSLRITANFMDGKLHLLHSSEKKKTHAINYFVSITVMYI